MACPLFFPSERFGDQSWRPRPALPLGDPYEGECRAGTDVYRPGEDELRNFCNLGYARARCPRFPAGCGSDAVRFAVSLHQDGVVVVAYVLERDYRPFEHGRLEYDLANSSFRSPHLDPNVQRQAQAYVGAYLRNLEA